MSKARYFCPKCKRNDFPSFEEREAHTCEPKTGLNVPAVQKALVVAKLEKLPVAGITGTWDGARKWLDAVSMLEQSKLFAQVMLGFELLALRAALPNESGKRTDLTSSSSRTRWEEALDKELGGKVGRSTAYELMRMADQAKPRLKKLPELAGFDPTAQAVSSLPEKQHAALSTAVKKLTDGKNQVDFMRELGLAKSVGAGAGRKTGDGGRPAALSFSEQAALMKATALKDMRGIGGLLDGYKASFTLLDDPDVRTLESLLERHLKAVRQWLAKPAAERDATVIEALFAED